MSSPSGTPNRYDNDTSSTYEYCNGVPYTPVYNYCLQTVNVIWSVQSHVCLRLEPVTPAPHGTRAHLCSPPRTVSCGSARSTGSERTAARWLPVSGTLGLGPACAPTVEWDGRSVLSRRPETCRSFRPASKCTVESFIQHALVEKQTTSLAGERGFFRYLTSCYVLARTLAKGQRAQLAGSTVIHGLNADEGKRFFSKRDPPLLL